MAEEFDRLQTQGAKEFGVDWLTMNMCVKEAAEKYGLNARDNRTLLTGIAYRACQTFAKK